MNKIVIGNNEYVFNGDKIRSVNGNFAVDYSGNTLSVDNVKAVIEERYKWGKYLPKFTVKYTDRYNIGSVVPLALDYGQEIPVYKDVSDDNVDTLIFTYDHIENVDTLFASGALSSAFIPTLLDGGIYAIRAYGAWTRDDENQQYVCRTYYVYLGESDIETTASDTQIGEIESLNNNAYSDGFISSAPSNAFAVSGVYLSNMHNDVSLSIDRGTPFYYYKDDELVCKMVVDSVKTDGSLNTISAISPIGLLDDIQDYGGMYEATENKKVIDALVSIIGGTQGTLTQDNMYPVTGGIFDFYVEKSVADTQFIGYLPIQSKRDNLHWVLTPYAIRITKASNGDVLFSYMIASEQESEIETVFIAKSDTKNIDEISSVLVTEYDFVRTEEVETLFDNTDTGGGNNILVRFGEPHYELKWNNVALTGNYNCNYAIVIGSGVLTGKKYARVEQTVSKGNDGYVGSLKEKKLVGMTTVNQLNANVILDTMLAYFGKSKQETCDHKVDGQTCGHKYKYKNSYGETHIGYLQEISFSADKIIRSKSKMITGFNPANIESPYENGILLTSGNWTVPDGVTKAKFAIIGGGNGGDPGENGENGERGTGTIYTTYKTHGGNGGEGGQGGNGGKVNVVELDLTPGDTISISYGVGGESEQDGTPTSITYNGTSYSSEDGERQAIGYINLFTGKLLAKKGISGVKGGKGGDAYIDGEAHEGESVSFLGSTFAGGAKGISIRTGYGVVHDEGAGGGAAYGTVGGMGRPSDEDDSSCAGGNGANAKKPPQADIGCGGIGGNGGGGGGGGGSHVYISPVGQAMPSTPYSGGTGGTGSQGGKGGNGGVLIYY